ncbi:alpha/beta fold hydrolase [Erwinia billingiae]|uniref:alpha/beta fold hydrolase n=1 Tax=Erwinia billingiae TaxID=182337 RepID=UPI00224615DE|nr:alpha/beta hydrolase [Erwinia billingiae]MCX0500629.1 alpha/beta hydrolase [Erwinia billingiae]
MKQPTTESVLPRRTEAEPTTFADSTLPGFVHRYANVEGVRLHYVCGGNPQGETLVLLAGFPQSWFAWRQVMARLASTYRIIAPDLPGQGDSDRPETGYDTRSLATKVHGLLSSLAISRYYLAAHDVGAWVAWPYAALYGDEVKRLALLDAGIPGITLPDALPVSPDVAWKTWHFAFHVIPDLPEALIAGHERVYLEWFLKRKTACPDVFSETDMDEYLRILMNNGGLRAGLAYYRSAALSAQQNRELQANGKLSMPILAISADQGSIPDMAAPLRPFAENVSGVVVPYCGHFLPEEQPEAIAREVSGFFKS